MPRPLGPAFVVGAVRGGLAALVPFVGGGAVLAVCSLAVFDTLPTLADVAVVGALVLPFGVGLGIGDAVSVRLDGLTGRGARFLGAFGGALLAAAQAQALEGWLSGHASLHVDPDRVMSLLNVAVVVGIGAGAGLAAVGVPVPRAGLRAVLGKATRAGLVCGVTMYGLIAIGAVLAGKNPFREIGELVAATAVSLGFGALHLVGLRLARPVAWRLRQWVEPPEPRDEPRALEESA